VENIELRSEQEGFAHLSILETSSVTLASLKEAIAKTPFTLDNVEWTVQAKEKTAGNAIAP